MAEHPPDAPGPPPVLPYAGPFSRGQRRRWLLGLVVASLALLPDISPVWRLALVTGFLGGLTTFSNFSIEVVTMLMEGRLGIALATAASHVCGSLVLTWLGVRTVHAFTAA